MVREQNQKNIRRADGATRTQSKGGVAAVGSVTSAACSGEAAGREVEGSLPLAFAVVGGGLPGPRLSMLSLRKLVGLKQRLEAGESLHITSAAGLISWRYNRRPENCPYLVTEFCSGAFRAWLTEPEKVVLDAVMEAGRSGQDPALRDGARSSQGEESDPALRDRRVPTSGGGEESPRSSLEGAPTNHGKGVAA